MHTDLVLDALEQALWSSNAPDGLVHHNDRSSHYLSIRYTERLAEAGVDSSVGNVGDSYDNALVETIIGLFKTEVIHRHGPWRTMDAVEYATLEWYRLVQPSADTQGLINVRTFKSNPRHLINVRKLIIRATKTIPCVRHRSTIAPMRFPKYRAG